MHEKIGEKISVVSLHNRDQEAYPFGFKWQGQLYRVEKIGYHHKVREGRNLQHIFSVTDGQYAFRLKYETDNLTWTLEEVSDGTAD